MQASALPSAPLLTRAVSRRLLVRILPRIASILPLSPPGYSGCARQRPNVNPPLGGWGLLVALSSRSRPVLFVR